MAPQTDADDAGAIEVPLPDHELGIANAKAAAKEDEVVTNDDEESPSPAVVSSTSTSLEKDLGSNTINSDNNAEKEDNANPGGPVPVEEEEEEDEKLFSFLTGMKNDLIARQPYYNFKSDCGDDNDGSSNKNDSEPPYNEPIRGDWSIPKNFFTVFNATIFAFVIQLIPALIFAELMDRQT
jgi:hypothetical protein